LERAFLGSFCFIAAGKAVSSLLQFRHQVLIGEYRGTAPLLRDIVVYSISLVGVLPFFFVTASFPSFAWNWVIPRDGDSKSFPFAGTR
jgi:hypothetical protein